MKRRTFEKLRQPFNPPSKKMLCLNSHTVLYIFPLDVIRVLVDGLVSHPESLREQLGVEVDEGVDV
jgi:hypothetical protein